MNAASAAAPAVEQSRGSRAPDLTPTQLKALKPHVITLTDGRLDREPTPNPRSAKEFATVAADIDAIFRTHLPKFKEDRGLGTVRIVLYAHGGLVDEESGFAAAQKQIDWWKAHDVYPIHFVWKTGAWSAIWDAIGRWVTGGSRGVLDEIKDKLIEEGARALGGEQVWLDMKLDAAASSDVSGGARRFVEKLAAWMKADPDGAEVHAIGHSAGSIFHSHLIPAAIAAGVPRIETVSFLAPAVRMDTFRTKLLPHADKLGNLIIFTMSEQAELDDNCFNAYGKSLLYLVAASFEKNRGTPILGLAKDIKNDAAVKAFLDGPKGEVVLSPNTKSVPAASTAISHGDFDDDRPTMESVLLRVTGLQKVKMPFPSNSRAIDPFADVVFPDAPRGIDGKTALCVGIDDYKRPADRLKGAVRDSELWGRELGKAGFKVTPLTNNDATRANILGSLFQMVTTASAGDLLVFQYAGHGTFAPDLEGGDEDDDHDEAICPVDFRSGQLVLDDDMAKIWDLIPESVTLTIFFDSCHSGGANREVTPGNETLPRGVTLTARDRAAFRVARGVAASTDMKGALALVEKSEPDNAETVDPDLVDDEEVPTGEPREVTFSACQPDQLAWETNGQGDFTGFVAPLLAANVGRVSNRQFFEMIDEGFDKRRQAPWFDPASPQADKLLLGSGPGGAAEKKPSTPTSAAKTEPRETNRDAAIAMILRGIADLIES